MKKFLVILLALCLLLSCAACGNRDEEQGETPVSDTNLTPYEEDPLITEVEGELADVETLLGQTITLPEEWEASRCTVIDDYMGQIEFSIGEDSYVARYAKGQHENMSGLEKDFTDTQTVEINGVSVTIRYTNPESSSSVRTFAVADAYDGASDTTFCIIQKTYTSVEDLTAAMEALMNSVAQGEPAPETGENGNDGE